MLGGSGGGSGENCVVSSDRCVLNAYVLDCGVRALLALHRDVGVGGAGSSNARTNTSTTFFATDSVSADLRQVCVGGRLLPSLDVHCQDVEVIRTFFSYA